jgi:hypothetical protein
MAIFALTRDSKTQPVTRKARLLNFFCDLNIAVRLMLIRVRAAARLRLARFLYPAPDADAVVTLRYDETKLVPRNKPTLAEACRHENAVADRNILSVILPVQLKMMYYRFFRKASLAELYREFASMTEPDAHYADDMVVSHLFNGMWPLPFQKDPFADNRLYWEQRYDQYDLDGVGELPGLRFEVELYGGAPRLASITFYPRGEGRRVVCTPDSAASWLPAKLAAMGIWHYLGTATVHVAGCHLNIEQYFLALRRNIRPGHPLYKLLHPHLKGCVAVNHFGDLTSWGKEGALNIAGPLSADGLQMLLRDALAEYDWKGWQPPVPFGAFHFSAIQAHVYWPVLTEYVERYFALHEGEFAAHWHALDGFSRDLVAHAPSRKDGTPSVSPITGATRSEEMQNLKELCRYLIYWVTFEHVRVHQALPYLFAQPLRDTLEAYQRATDSDAWYDAYAKNGVVLAFVRGINELMRMRKVRTILQNYDGDVPELFLRILVAHKSKFDAVGFDISRLCQVIV